MHQHLATFKQNFIIYLFTYLFTKELINYLIDYLTNSMFASSICYWINAYFRAYGKGTSNCFICVFVLLIKDENLFIVVYNWQRPHRPQLLIVCNCSSMHIKRIFISICIYYNIYMCWDKYSSIIQRKNTFLCVETYRFISVSGVYRQFSLRPCFTFMSYSTWVYQYITQSFRQKEYFSSPG